MSSLQEHHVPFDRPEPVPRACTDRPQVRPLAEVGRSDLADCAAPCVGSGIPCVSGVIAVDALRICQLLTGNGRGRSMRNLSLDGLASGDFRRVQGLAAQDGVVQEAELLFNGPVAGDDEAGDGWLTRQACLPQPQFQPPPPSPRQPANLLPLSRLHQTRRSLLRAGRRCYTP